MSGRDRPPEEARPARRFGKRHVLLVLACGLLALEGVVRVRQAVRFGTGSASMFASVVHAGTGREIPAPGSVRGPIRIDERGFRSPPVTDVRPPRTIRLAMIGGSTTYCAEVTSNDATWPAVATARLAERFPDVEFEHVNAGVPGYGTAASLDNLRERIVPLAPDVVLVYHATNDLSLDARALAHERGIYEQVEGRQPSLLGRWSLALNLIEKNLEVRASARAATAEVGKLQFDADELALGFTSRMGALLEVAGETAPVVGAVTFSPRVRREQDPAERTAACVTSLYYTPFMTPDGLLAGFDAYNDGIRRAASEQGALLLEAAAVIPSDAEHFVDSVHLTDAGARRLAEVVVDGLAADPGFQALVEARARE